MADKFGLNGEVRELKIGKSFEKNVSHHHHHQAQQQQSAAFHTVRYDFKPASVDPTQNGVLQVDENASVSITVPHMHGNGHTKFSGRVKNANAKECILIIDRDTGEITIEALSSQLLVKKTRPEKPSTELPASIPSAPAPANHSSRSQNRSKQPPIVKQSQVSKTSSELARSASPSALIMPTPPPAANEAKKKAAAALAASSSAAAAAASLSESSSSSSSSSSDDSSSSDSGSDNEDNDRPKPSGSPAMSMPMFGVTSSGSGSSGAPPQPSMPSFCLPTKSNGVSVQGRSPVLGRPAQPPPTRAPPPPVSSSASMPELLNGDLELSESDDDSD